MIPGRIGPRVQICRVLKAFLVAVLAIKLITARWLTQMAYQGTPAPVGGDRKEQATLNRFLPAADGRKTADSKRNFLSGGKFMQG